MSRRLAVALSIVALLLTFAWNFVPADVPYDGATIRCWPASVDRSSPPDEVTGRVLACRPIATLRERQGVLCLAIVLLLIWVTHAALRHRRMLDQSEDGPSTPGARVDRGKPGMTARSRRA